MKQSIAFLDLPQEVRDLVYAEVCDQPLDQIIAIGEQCKQPGAAPGLALSWLALAMTCQQITMT